MRTPKKGAGQSESEARANEADPFQAESLEVPLTEAEKAQMDANLRGLAVGLKRENETDEEAFERVKSSRYLITYRHDEYWPFYHVESKFGRIILTINTAHPFFTKLYEPVLRSSIPTSQDDTEVEVDLAPRGPVVALELMLLSLARAQTLISRDNTDAVKLFEAFRRSWSNGLQVQLTD